MRVMMITGAGISASSGLPTYRGPNGLYTKIEEQTGMAVERLLSAQTLLESPELIWRHWLSLSLAIENASPTPTHHAMKALSEHSRVGKGSGYSPSKIGRLYDCTAAINPVEVAGRGDPNSFLEVTQNVDGLSRITGINSKDVVELHGSYRRHWCTHCKAEAELTIHADMEIPPPCQSCSTPGAFLRPRVVMFGEKINHFATSFCEEYARTIDLLVVTGTSLQFAYIAGLIQEAIVHDAVVVYIDPHASPYKSTLLALDFDLEIDQKMICIRKSSDDVVPLLSKLLIEGNPTKDELRQWCEAQTRSLPLRSSYHDSENARILTQI